MSRIHSFVLLVLKLLRAFTWEIQELEHFREFWSFPAKVHLKVVTNEKGEAVGEVVTIICNGGGGAGCFFVILMGCHLV